MKCPDCGAWHRGPSETWPEAELLAHIAGMERPRPEPEYRPLLERIRRGEVEPVERGSV